MMYVQHNRDILQQAVESAIGAAVELARVEPLAGGDSSAAWRCVGAGGRWFVKLGDAGDAAAFEAEFLGLEALLESRAVRVPRPLGTGSGSGRSWLVLEHLELTPSGDSRQLGRALTGLHRCTGEAFGWHRDNFIGPSAQANGWMDDWVGFFWQRRLQPQFESVARQGHPHLREAGERLRERLPDLLGGHRPEPSLLHGDLWGGNHAYLPDGVPVVFDPAVHYGDREADLAMMALFGGFHPEVLSAYTERWPLPDGHQRRRPLYQLYHLLNHLRLFGAGWLGRVESVLRTLL